MIQLINLQKNQPIIFNINLYISQIFLAQLFFKENPRYCYSRHIVVIAMQKLWRFVRPKKAQDTAECWHLHAMLLLCLHFAIELLIVL